MRVGHSFKNQQHQHVKVKQQSTIKKSLILLKTKIKKLKIFLFSIFIFSL